MASVEKANCVEAAVIEYRLSHRGTCNFAYRDVWGPRERSMANPWSSDNPDGTVILHLAENSLLHEEMGVFIKTQINVLPTDHLTYSTGPRDSRRLRRAAAAFLSEEFQSQSQVTADDLFITSGIASAIDAVAWAVCNEGVGILVPRPFYNGFQFDTLNRSNARLVGIAYEGIQGYSGLDDLFHPEVNSRALEAAYRKATKEGISPKETLIVFAGFRGRHSLHFISDEIYALSVFSNPAIQTPIPFISTLALGLDDPIDPTLHHVLHGASKVFCGNGLGIVYTKNQGMIGAMPSIRQRMHAFMRKKTRLMEENLRIATSFFRERGIPYYETNSSLFIWIDLRHLFISGTRSKTLPSNKSDADYTTLQNISSESQASIYQESETRITDACAKNGVMIAPGSGDMPEEYGWFRITFTVPKEMLMEGLKRFWRALEEV
ncbi:PLP-dependent transferase [Aspergillus pseudoustus]|uniref:PLP-dependent transferase n=1 Tax=Aspergillus pseudoustus TaxID=1810923 RepID=A0ABR4KKX3_9EURO